MKTERWPELNQQQNATTDVDTDQQRLALKHKLINSLLIIIKFIVTLKMRNRNNSK